MHRRRAYELVGFHIPVGALGREVFRKYEPWLKPRRLKLDFIPMFFEDYYLLGKRETIERADVEAIVMDLKSREFAQHVHDIPGYDTSRTGEVSNLSDLVS